MDTETERQTDRQTDKATDHVTQSVAIGHIKTDMYRLTLLTLVSTDSINIGLIESLFLILTTT